MKSFLYILSFALLLSSFNLSNGIEVEIEEVKVEFCVQKENRIDLKQYESHFVEHIFLHIENIYKPVYLSEEQQPPELLS